MFVFGLYFMMKKFVFDLVDEVWDDGDTLLVKNRGQDVRIAIEGHQKRQLFAAGKSAACYRVAAAARPL